MAVFDLGIARSVLTFPRVMYPLLQWGKIAMSRRPNRLWCWWSVAQEAVKSLGVVVHSPAFGEHFRLQQRFEQMTAGLSESGL